jgi:VIT1/CCC1 family predicted Fe2+/Mn2+ transporter
MPTHEESHRSIRIGWLRAAVLGANDGTISVASLIVGVAAAGTDRHGILLTGIAGLVAGAMSMAAGEYVSVKSQADTEDADIARERYELHTEPDRELAELTAIYMARGLDRTLAHTVAEKLMVKDALGAHLRDELGITDASRAQPIQAALASAISFSVGAIVPIIPVLLAPSGWIATCAFVTALLMLVVLGATAAKAGGASVARGATRVAFWGVVAMALTAAIGHVFGAVG